MFTFPELKKKRVSPLKRSAVFRDTGCFKTEKGKVREETQTKLYSSVLFAGFDRNSGRDAARSGQSQSLSGRVSNEQGEERHRLQKCHVLRKGKGK